MNTAPVTVMIPVGPYAAYKQWLPECLASARAQTHPPDEVLIIDDMADVGPADGIIDGSGNIRVWRTPWRIGDVGAFNCGVGLARNDLVFLLSCDDMLRPDCLELCIAEWEAHGRKDAYYYVGAHYIAGEWPDQTVPFGNAMVTKGLWRLTGGIPLAAASGAGDAAHISIMMVHFPDRLIPVAGGKPLYDYRVHGQSVTSKMGPWSGVVDETRRLVTELWQPPEWGRMS